MAERDPSKTVAVDDPAADLAGIVAEAESGLETILTRDGRPIAKVVPFEPVVPPRRQPGGWPTLGLVPESVWFDPLPEDELALWEGKRLEKHGF